MRTLRVLMLGFLVSGAALAADPVPHRGKPVEQEQIAHGTEKATHKEVHPTDDHGEGHQQPQAYFGIPAWILKLANMILFVAVLGYVLRRPLRNALNSRSERLIAQANEARERSAKADQMATDIQTRISRLEGEVASILSKAEEDGERQKQELIAAANEEAEKILRSARNEVDARLKLARKELTEYAGELAAARAQQLLEQTLTDADRRRIFDESIDSISRQRS